MYIVTFQFVFTLYPGKRFYTKR